MSVLSGTVAGKRRQAVRDAFLELVVALAIAHELIDRSEIQDLEALSFDEAPVLVPPLQQVAPVQLDCAAKTICSCLRELSAGTVARGRDCLQRRPCSLCELG